LTRAEAYLVVVLVFVAVIVAIIGNWPWITIVVSLGAGVLLLALLILDSLANPDVDREASIADIDVRQVRDPDLKSKVLKALQYVRAIQRLSKRNVAALDAADDELPQLEQSVRSIYQMSLRLQEFRSDDLLQRDLADLERHRRDRGELDKDREAYLNTLTRLNQMVRAADQEIDSALAHLGRSYAEMQAIKVTPEFRGGTADTLNQLKSSTLRLAELAQGYDEVYGARTVAEGSERQK
jgi:hypothetical protein